MASDDISRPMLPMTGDLMTAFDLLNLLCIAIILGGVEAIALTTIL
jgi:hypothetical protein